MHSVQSTAVLKEGGGTPSIQAGGQRTGREVTIFPLRPGTLPQPMGHLAQSLPGFLMSAALDSEI